MSGNSDIAKRQEKIEGTVQQQKETFKQDIQGMDMELSNGAETEREHGTKRPPTGA